MKKTILFSSIILLTTTVFCQFMDAPVKLKGTHKYYNLRNDDPKYNKKYSSLVPLGEVVQINLMTWGLNRYILDKEYARISINTIQDNLKSSWVWDTDKFYMNFFGHPYHGSLYFNAARSNGYNYFESIPFTIFGSLMWEYTMENTKPSRNDLINTTISGIFLGEVLYRLSSNILDDRLTGGSRFFRELVAGLLNPVRAFNRILQGKLSKVTKKEVYQKEPMDVTISGGVHRINEDLGFEKGNLSGLVTANLVYGDPYERRFRKPFDFFELDLGVSIAPGSLKNTGKYSLDHLLGSGILTGNNSKHGRLELLTGIYQHYDYWSTRYFEIGTIGLGGGLKFQIPHSKTFRFESSVHLNAVPFGASNSVYTSVGERNYNFAGGLEAKTENTLYLGIASISAAYYYYWLHTFVGEKGNNLLGILIPKVTLKIYDKLGIGAEYLLYHKDSYLKDFPNVSTRNSELRFYILVSSGYFEF